MAASNRQSQSKKGKYMNSKTSLVCIAMISVLPGLAYAGAVVRSASGAAPADIQGTDDQFRTDVSAGGVENAPGTGPFAIGRLAINRDGAPDSISAPNPFH